MIQALIFDFDGTILDTETVVYQSWQEIYQEYHCFLPLEKWVMRVGGSTALFDAHSYLETLHGQPISRKDLDRKRIERQQELLASSCAFPGVEPLLLDAKLHGLKIGLASSSERDWVEGHLLRLGLSHYFDCIRCCEDVLHTKPHPDLYLSVLSCLDVHADQAIAIEDSPNGVRAAQQAGIFCVAVPNAITNHLPLDHADLRLASLTDTSVEHLMTIHERSKTSRKGSDEG